MAILLLLAFFAITVIDVWAASAVMFRRGHGSLLTFFYWLALLFALVAAIAMTGFFSYHSNPNTHLFGWPIPRAVFQRDTAASQWLDFVGPTMVLAYPMNFMLYLFVPSVVFLFLSGRQRHETADDA